MAKSKQYYAVNNQEDEDSSSYPLYPETAYIYSKEKSKKRQKAENKVTVTISIVRNHRKQSGKKNEFTNSQSQ